MNERIRELIKQATTIEEHKWGVSYDNFNKEKFAELLVLECINTVMDGTREGDYYAMRIEHHFDNGPGGILQFGVEE